MLVGVADDLWDLDWMIKLGAQFLAAGIIAWFGELQIYSLPIGGLTVGSGSVSFTLTVFSIVIVMNAVNFIDGLDGLVAGVCLIANGVFFAYSYMLVARLHRPSTFFNLATFIAAVLIGACLGFLPLNWSPAKLFMGDAGALMLGLLMACSAIAITGSSTRRCSTPRSSAARSCSVPSSRSCCRSSSCCCRCSTSASPSSAACGPASRRSRPTASTCTTGCSTWATRDRDAVLIFYAWTAIVGLAVLLMYIGTHAELAGGLPPRRRLRRRRRRRLPRRDPSALAPRTRRAPNPPWRAPDEPQSRLEHPDPADDAHLGRRS